MFTSTRQFTTGLIDYAGLFPPAGLELPAAIDAYATYRAGVMAPMLARFICPVARLESFHTLAGDRAQDWPLSVLAASADAPNEALIALEQDMRRVGEFHAASGARVESVETRFPTRLADAPRANIAATLRAMGDALSVADIRELYLEVGFADGWPERLRILVDGVAEASVGCPVRLGLKIRTGGLEASAFPTVEQVAGFLIDARESEIPFKATAGLHHPVRHFAASVNTHMHGFLNVFVGAALYWHDRISTETLRDVLREENPSAFQFSPDGLAWEDVSVSADELGEARAAYATSFGSCSFLEPWQDLHDLGLVDAPPPDDLV